MTQILNQHAPRRIGEGQHQWLSGLALSHSDLPLAPADVFEPQGADIAGAQPIGGDQKQHRIVTHAHRAAAIDGGEQSANAFPRQRAGKLFQSVQAGGVNVRIQPWWERTRGHTKPEKTPQMSGIVLQGCPAMLLA